MTPPPIKPTFFFTLPEHFKSDAGARDPLLFFHAVLSLRTEKQNQNFGNGDLRGKPDKQIAELEIPVPGKREEQASQQGGPKPQDQK